MKRKYQVIGEARNGKQIMFKEYKITANSEAEAIGKFTLKFFKNPAHADFTVIGTGITAKLIDSEYDSVMREFYN